MTKSKPNTTVTRPTPRPKQTTTQSTKQPAPTIRTVTKPTIEAKNMGPKKVVTLKPGTSQKVMTGNRDNQVAKVFPMQSRNKTLSNREAINQKKLSDIRKSNIATRSIAPLYSTRNRNTKASHTSVVIRHTPAYRSVNRFGFQQKHFYYNNHQSRARRHFCHHSSISFHLGLSFWDPWPSTYWSYSHYYPWGYRYYDPWRPYRSVYYNDYYPRTVYYEPLVVVNAPEPERVVVTAPQIHVSRQEQLIGLLLFEDAEKREDAAYELANHRNMSSIAALTDTMINDAEPAVRAASAYSLGIIENPIAYEGLMRCASAEYDEQVKAAAVNGAKHIKELNGPDRLVVREKYPPMNLGKDTLGERLELLRFGTEHQRRVAADQLRENKGTQTVAALINTLINDSDQNVREAAADSLGKIADPMALPFLKDAEVNDNDRSVRSEIKVAIARIVATNPN